MVLKKFCALIVTAVLMAALVVPALAVEVVPYDTYNYDYRERVVLTPAAYVPGDTVSGVKLGIGAFKSPQGMTISDIDGLVYVADTGNNRVAVLSPDMSKVVTVIETFGDGDTFKAPYGVAVSTTDELYIADKENHRVVVLAPDRKTVVKIISDPQSEVLPANFEFSPLKVTVDYADRVYVVASMMFQGIMMFDPDCQFTGFFGTIEVQITAWEKFWRAISTKAERSRQQLFIPTEFTGLDVDPAGFVYASNVDPEGVKAVRRLNPKGEDVLLQGDNANTGGDLRITGNSEYAGTSYIVDVVYRGKGIYSILDSKRGRIFTYDREGNLLYIFGGLGTQAGTFSNSPTAIEHIGDRIMVLDALRNEIITFQETKYGALINDAVALRYDGDETKAVAKWEEVLLLNENLELANVGIGKAYLTSGDNVKAMHYLKLGMNRNYYSIAFKRWRNDILKDNLNWAFTVIVVLIVGYIVWRQVRKRRRGESGKEGLL
ncbi:hypothetical protein FACS1894217_02880 [Clostridia bacterium]|nr:hypothetical protein FACS1894217_02880 [Clostridia bacterium]